MKAPLDLFDRISEWGTLSLGLERVRAVLDTLGEPQLSYPHILVGGTNGKGTVCASVAASLGPRVGLFLSPHVHNIRERITIDDQWVPDSAWREAYASVKASGSSELDNLSYFEWLLVLAVLIFKQAGVAYAVFEVGVGGELDATNVLSPELSAITNVGTDHQALLGHDRSQIAIQKLGIGRPGKPLLVPKDVTNLPGVADFLILRELSVQTFENKGVFDDNFALAELILQQIGKDSAKLEKRSLPGRREYLDIGSGVYIDGAHNPEGWMDTLSWITGKTEGRRINLVVSLSGGRDPQILLDLFQAIYEDIYLFDAGYERELSREAWSIKLKSLREENRAKLFQRPLLACGSLYMIGPFKQWLLEGAQGLGPNKFI